MSAAEQPRKPQSAYWIWLGENRQSLQKELPGKKASEVSKLAGKQWQAMSSEQKAPYEQQAKEAKEAYEKALEEYKARGGIVAKRGSKTDGKDGGSRKQGDGGRSEDAPKRPAGGAYGCFVAEKRGDIKAALPADHKMTDVTKKAAELWKTMSDAEKSKYEKAYKEKMEQYKAAMEEYRKSTPNSDAKAQEATPKKRAASNTADSPAAKQSKGSAKGSRKSSAPEIVDAKVAAEALKLGEEYERNLRSLAGREDVKALGKSAQEMLNALKGANGLLHPARRALLGA